MAIPTSAQDWANFDRYQEANAEVGPVPEERARVVFMGDSITEGWREAYPEFWESSDFVNRGISGEVTAQMLIRFRQDVVELNPATVFILAGTNDIAENLGPTTLQAITDNIKSMAEVARANEIDVIIASVLPASEYGWRPGLEPDIKIPALNAMLKSYAETSGIRYVDLFSRMTDGENGLREELTTDGVHLTREGYRVMSEIVSAALAG